jgi:hypothetical protein
MALAQLAACCFWEMGDSHVIQARSGPFNFRDIMGRGRFEIGFSQVAEKKAFISEDSL